MEKANLIIVRYNSQIRLIIERQAIYLIAIQHSDKKPLIIEIRLFQTLERSKHIQEI